MSKLISHDTVLKIYIYHEINNLQLHNLSKECVSYIDEESNALAVLNSPEFLKLSEEHLTTLLSRDTLLVPEREVLVAVLRWKEHNQKDVAEVVGCIRLGRFTMREMFTTVQPSGLFTDAQILGGLKVLTMPLFSEIKPRGRMGELSSA